MQKKVEYKITIPKEILGKYKCKKYRKKKKTEFKGSFSYSCSGSKNSNKSISLFMRNMFVGWLHRNLTN